MQPNAPAASTDDALGFGEYLGVLKKRRRLLLMVALPIIAAAAAFAIVPPDVYHSSGLIEIEQASGNEVLGRTAADSEYADEYVQSLSRIVLSNKNLARLLDEHQLYEDQAQPESGALDRLMSDIDVDIVTAQILDPNTGRERKIVTAFTVGYDHRDPERARDGAVWLVEAFLAQNRADRQAVAAQAAEFFGDEAERVRQQVAKMESRLAEFKSKHSGSLPELAQANLTALDRTETEIRNIETQLQALRRERVFLTSQLQQARAVGPETANLRQLEAEYNAKSVQYDESHPDMIALRRQIETLRAGGSTAAMTLRGQLQQQRSILSEARQRYSEDHPDVKRLMRNIEALEARIASGESADTTLVSDSPVAVQLQTQVNATDTQLAALQSRLTELRTKMGQLETRITTTPEVEREYQIVTRDLAGARAKYDELLKRQMDAEVNEAAIVGGTVDRFRVASIPGVPNKPAKPKRLAIFVIGLVFALGVGLSAVIMAQLFDATVRGVRDIREILGVTPLAAVPVIQQPSNRTFGRRRAVQLATRTAVLIAAVAATAGTLANLFWLA